jgi:hypothetical protein
LDHNIIKVVKITQRIDQLDASPATLANGFHYPVVLFPIDHLLLVKPLGKLCEFFGQIVSDRQVGEWHFVCLSETVDVLVEQVFSGQVFVKRVMVDSLENYQFVHVELWLAPRPKQVPVCF